MHCIKCIRFHALYYVHGQPINQLYSINFLLKPYFDQIKRNVKENVGVTRQFVPIKLIVNLPKLYICQKYVNKHFSSTIERYKKSQNIYFFAVISESVYIQYTGMKFIMGPWVKSIDGSVKSFDIKKQL